MLLMTAMGGEIGVPKSLMWKFGDNKKERRHVETVQSEYEYEYASEHRKAACKNCAVLLQVH